jgi:L-alanine-DL-glutamate epimerase-like enolase superfamily enzyme
LKIAAALDDFNIYWREEPVWMQNFDDVARYRDKVNAPVAGSENLGALPWYREMFVRGAIDVANFDIAWVGGITEAKRTPTNKRRSLRPASPTRSRASPSTSPTTTPRSRRRARR